MTTLSLGKMLPSPARIASTAAVLVLLALMTAPFAFAALAAGGPAHADKIDEKPMCYAAGVGCGAGPSMEIALFAPRH